MALVKQTVTRFRDLDLSFERHPATNDVSRLVDNKAINRSIRNLVFTDIYESPFHPEISCGIRKLLFEPMTSMVLVEIQKNIENVINNFEPRVSLTSVNVEPNYGQNAIAVNVVYQIIGLSDYYQVNFNLERGI